MKYVVWALIVLLIMLRQDNWNWGKDTLVLGFLPIGLAWHAGISIAASAIWYLFTIFAWPKELEVAEADAVADQEASS